MDKEAARNWIAASCQICKILILSYIPPRKTEEFTKLDIYFRCMHCHLRCSSCWNYVGGLCNSNKCFRKDPSCQANLSVARKCRNQQLKRMLKKVTCYSKIGTFLWKYVGGLRFYNFSLRNWTGVLPTCLKTGIALSRHSCALAFSSSENIGVGIS